MAESAQEGEHGSSDALSPGAAGGPGGDVEFADLVHTTRARSGVQIAHPYVADEEYRRFADELDWGII